MFDATTTRQSMSYTDPVTSKTATLTFKDVTINVNQQSQYDRVLVYLIPDSLSSFQRVEQQGGGFKESLNSLFRYNAVAIGYKGEQMFFAQERSLSEAVYSLELTAITEKQFREALQQYSKRISKELKEETDYRLFEQQEELRQIQLENERVLREQVAAAIFKCGGAK